MTELKQEDIVDTTSVSPETVETVVVDPLKTELEKVQKSGKTELEKAQYSLKKNAERLLELGGDPDAILGKKPIEQDDDKPVTRAELQELIRTNQTKTALQLADEISDVTERELVKHYLENRIVPSGNSQADLLDARRAVNSIKNEQIVEELSRKTQARTHSSATGAPALSTEAPTELTPEEALFLKPPFNMTKEAILKTRK